MAIWPGLCRADREKTSGGLHPLRPAGDGGQPSTTDLDQAERLHQRDEFLDARLLAGDLKHKMLGGRVDDLGMKRLGQTKRLDPLLALAGHLEQCELALD